MKSETVRVESEKYMKWNWPRSKLTIFMEHIRELFLSMSIDYLEAHYLSLAMQYEKKKCKAWFAPSILIDVE